MPLTHASGRGFTTRISPTLNHRVGSRSHLLRDSCDAVNAIVEAASRRAVHWTRRRSRTRVLAYGRAEIPMGYIWRRRG